MINKKRIGDFLKLGLALLLIYAIYSQLFAGEDWPAKYYIFQLGLKQASYLDIFLLLALMPINWGMDALKWRWLAKEIESISFRKAMKGVLCGITLSLFTPNRLGDFGGKVLVLSEGNKLKGIPLTLLSSFSQILTTGLMGSLAFYCLIRWFVDPTEQSIWWYPAIISGLLTIFGLFIYYHLGRLANWPVFRKQANYLRALGTLSKRKLTKVLGASIFRYLTFSFQFYLALRIMGVKTNIVEAYATIGSSHLVQTVVPSIALTDLPVKGSVIVYFMDYLTQNHLAVLAATLMIWVINLMIPALIGLLILLRMDFFKGLGNKETKL